MFCECGGVGCKERVKLGRDEFADLRAESRPLIVAAHVNGASSASRLQGVPVVDIDVEPMKVRIGKNEVMFRTANERIELEAQSVDLFVTPVPFFCECPGPQLHGKRRADAGGV